MCRHSWCWELWRHCRKRYDTTSIYADYYKLLLITPYLLVHLSSMAVILTLLHNFLQLWLLKSLNFGQEIIPPNPETFYYFEQSKISWNKDLWVQLTWLKIETYALTLSKTRSLLNWSQLNKFLFWKFWMGHNENSIHGHRGIWGCLGLLFQTACLLCDFDTAHK